MPARHRRIILKWKEGALSPEAVIELMDYAEDRGWEITRLSKFEGVACLWTEKLVECER